MKKVLLIIAAAILIALTLLAGGCEPMLEEYQSDTYELGESTIG